MGLANPLRDPWAITQAGFELVVAIASRGDFFALAQERALQARDGKPLNNSRTVEVRDGVAIIPVEGPLFRHADLFTDISGATSYATLRKDLQRALDEPSVKAILFEIDSPGGEVTGVDELSSAIFAARGKKRIVAFADGYMASAAYWIGCAAGEVVTSLTGMPGSIGVRTLLVDDSEADEKLGLKKYTIQSSQSPRKVVDPANEDDRARVQATIDALAAEFVERVARNRGVSVEKVLSDFGQGDVLVGQAAVDAGLADRVGDVESLIAELAADAPPSVSSTQGAAAMKRTMSPGAASATIGDEQCNACGRSMTASDSAYCAGCFDDDEDEEEARALGLDSKASRADRQARIAHLVRFEKDAIAATGTPDADTALGRMRAGAEAIGERDRLRADVTTQLAITTQREFRVVLESALTSRPPRLSLGQLAKTVPTFLDDPEEAKAKTAIAGITHQTAAALLDAICGKVGGQAPAADVPQATPKTLARLRAFVEAQGPVTPSGVDEPAPRPGGKGVIVTKEQAAEMGMTLARAQQLAEATSVADVIRPANANPEKS